MSKHGVAMTCSYCGDKGHNKKGCKLRKAGVVPNRQPHSIDPVPFPEDEELRQGDQGEAEPSNTASPVHVLHQEDMFDHAMAQVLAVLQMCLIS